MRCQLEAVKFVQGQQVDVHFDKGLGHEVDVRCPGACTPSKAGVIFNGQAGDGPGDIGCGSGLEDFNWKQLQ